MNPAIKRILCLKLALILLVTTLCVSPLSLFAVEGESPVVSYSFEEENPMLPALCGNAAVTFDEEKDSRVLSLDGSDGTYAQPDSTLVSGTDVLTVMFDVKPGNNNGNFFTFALGVDSEKYAFLRLRGNEIRYAVTRASYMNEAEAKGTLPYHDTWMNVALVLEGTACRLYVNGTLVAENADTGIRLTDLGTSLQAYFGKSFYNGDAYYQGDFDNIEVYQSALTQEEIRSKNSLSLPLLIKATVGSVLPSLSGRSGADSHTAVYTSIDREHQEIVSYVNTSQNVKKVPVSFVTGYEDCDILLDGAAIATSATVDLSKDRTLTFTRGTRTETYTLKAAQIAYNPVLNGQYADPDIDVLDGRFWLFPTTDGIAGWGGTQFSAFSSDDLVHWTDEGVILDVKEKTAKTNAKGVKIAVSEWSDINAWAPAIEAKNGKYYFYYCSNVAPAYTAQYGNGMAIGVAVASKPQGPYTAAKAPLVYPKMLQEANIGFSGQAIDPSVYTENGNSYLLFGNGMAAIVQLSSDMMHVQPSTLQLINNLQDFRESIAVFKRGAYYYFTWSCDDTGSENYHINYGTASSLLGNVTNRGTILQKRSEEGILGTGHQCVLYLPENDRCIIAYHRFYTPLQQVNDGFGFHREVCIDELTFMERGILMPLLNPVTPTYTGTGRINVKGETITTPYVPPSTPAAPTQTTTKKTEPTTKKPLPIVVKPTAIKKLVRGKRVMKVTWKKVGGVTGYQLQYSTHKKFKKKYTKTITIKKAGRTAKKIKKLRAKRRYYVRVRCYRSVKGKTYYSKWSKRKAVIIK